MHTLPPIAIVATQRDHCLVVVIEDDGEGLDLDRALEAGGLGIIGMRERAEMLGGTLTIESAPGSGTTVYIQVPLARPLPADRTLLLRPFIRCVHQRPAVVGGSVSPACTPDNKGPRL